MTITTETPTACAAEPATFDSTNVTDHQVARRLCVGCPAAEPCLSIGLTNKGTGTFAGQLLRAGRTVDLARPVKQQRRGAAS